MLVSVIIPIYKVEKFIQRCAQSLMRQSLQDLEYIFVDDCSPDKSIFLLKEILKLYPDKKNRVKIITHTSNRGLPTARNTGMKYASGKYIYQCDSDDYLELNALELLVHTAEKTNADIVWCDWFLSFEKNERYMKQPSYKTADAALRGILLGNMKYNVWNKLIRRSLYIQNSIFFPDGHSMGEDMTIIRLMACANTVAYVPKALYHYMKINSEAYTNRFTLQKISDIEYNINETINFLESNLGLDLGYEIACFKLNVKYPLLMSNDDKLYSKWEVWYPEANSYILKNQTMSFRSKLLQRAALKKQYWILHLYYKCIYRLIYGFIYK